MKNITVVVLGVLLAVAAGAGIFLYQQNLGLNSSLEESDKTIQNLRETVLASRDATIAELQKDLTDRDQRVLELEGTLSATNEKLRAAERDRAEELKIQKEKLLTVERELAAVKKIQHGFDAELSSRDARIAKLRDDIGDTKQQMQEMEQALSMKDEKLRAAEEALATEQNRRQELEAELSSQTAMIEKFEDELKNSRTRIQSLTGEFAQKESEIENVHHQILTLKGKNAVAETRMNQLKSTYDALITDLEQQIKRREVTIQAFKKKISVTFVDSVLFDLGKATITGEGQEILKGVGDILKGVQSKQIRIVGHTDDIPIAPQFRHRFPSNWELSTARAAAVVRYFQNEIDINPKNLEAVGRSFYEPISSNDTAAGRAQNRRVNIIIAPKAE